MKITEMFLPEHWDRECLRWAKYCNGIVERNLGYINHFRCYFWGGATHRLYEKSFVNYAMYNFSRYLKAGAG